MQFISDPASIPPEFLKTPEVKEAMDELQYLSMDKQTRAEYEARRKEINDYNAGVTKAEKKGREEGREEGKVEEKIKIAKNALAMGLAIEKVVELTGLSIGEINNSKNQ